MDPVLIFAYVVFCTICFSAYVFANWFTRNDATYADITAMTLVSMIPVLNLIFLLSSIMDFFEEWSKNSDATKVLIKGRTK